MDTFFFFSTFLGQLLKLIPASVPMALRMRGLPFILLKIKSERFRNILIKRFSFSFILGVIEA